MATRKQIIAACKKRWPNQTSIEIRENKSAPSAAQREVIAAERKSAKERKTIVDARLKEIGQPEAVLSELMTQAQFVLDGDPTALAALQKAMTSATEYAELRDESLDLSKRIRDDESRLYERRFSVSTWTPGDILGHSRACSDTLSECLSEIEWSRD